MRHLGDKGSEPVWLDVFSISTVGLKYFVQCHLGVENYFVDFIQNMRDIETLEPKLHLSQSKSLTLILIK